MFCMDFGVSQNLWERGTPSRKYASKSELLQSIFNSYSSIMFRSEGNESGRTDASSSALPIVLTEVSEQKVGALRLGANKEHINIFLTPLAG